MTQTKRSLVTPQVGAVGRIAAILVMTVTTAACTASSSGVTTVRTPEPTQQTGSAAATPMASAGLNSIPPPPVADGLRVVATITMSPMEAPRMTVLDDGRVLVTGFEPAPNNGGPTSLTPMLEVFDPTTEKFSPARDLPATVDTALPIRLADGRVLLAGGDGPAVAFDPATGELAEIGGMIRGGYTLAVLLDDGRVLYTGRLGDRDPGASEIYDATKERFLSTGALRTWRENAAVVALEDGRALVFGGDHNFGEAANGEDTIFNSVEAFDPATGAFSAVAPMVRERMELGAERLTDGRILIVGGDVPTSTVELYDPKGTSTEVGPFPGCGDPFSTVRLKDDRVLVACAGPSAIFDPATDTIKPAKLPISIAPTDAVLLADGRVLMVGEDDTALIIQP